jgi:hypothetical protein
MNEIFQDYNNTAVGILWAAGGLSPSMWSAEMNLFAWTSMYNHPMHLNLTTNIHW